RSRARLHGPTQEEDCASEARRRGGARSIRTRAARRRRHMPPAPIPPEETAGSGGAGLRRELRELQPPVRVAASAPSEVAPYSRTQSATIRLHLQAVAKEASIASPRWRPATGAIQR